jgi:phosphatidyl-myo-inositol dimannoside synthase
MRLLIVAKHYHPHVGGVETQTRLVAHRLAQRHDVAVAATTFRSRTLPGRLEVLEDSLLQERGDNYVDGSVPVHAVGPSRMDRLRLAPMAMRALPRQRWAYFPRRRRAYRHYRSVFLPKLRRLVRGRDVVHCVANHYFGWATLEAARAEGVPFVLTPYVHLGQHGDDPDSVAFYNKADVVFALLETDREKLIDLGVAGERIRLSGVVPLLPSSSDPAAFRSRHGLGDEPLVLYVGRIEEYKGVRALLEATALVWRAVPEAHFFFAGQPTADSRSWFTAQGDSRVRYLGLVSDQEKADAMAACDLFSMPSRFEILPAVYLEAWSYGKAVLAGSAQGLRELVEGSGAGVAVEQDPASIADHIVALLRDDERRRNMGRRGNELVKRRFSPEALVRTYETAFEHVTSVRATNA